MRERWPASCRCDVVCRWRPQTTDQFRLCLEIEGEVVSPFIAELEQAIHRGGTRPTVAQIPLHANFGIDHGIDHMATEHAQHFCIELATIKALSGMPAASRSW